MMCDTCKLKDYNLLRCAINRIGESWTELKNTISDAFRLKFEKEIFICSDYEEDVGDEK